MIRDRASGVGAGRPEPVPKGRPWTLVAILAVTLGAVGALSALGTTAGCSTTPNGADRADLTDDRSTLEQRLVTLAEDEAPGRVAPGRVALPQALAAVDLERRADAPTARLGLQAALAELDDDPEPEPYEPPAEDRRDAALGFYVRGMDAALQGDDETAIAALEEARALDPLAASVLRALAHRYGARGDMGMAIARFEDLLRVEPHDRDALLTVAMAENLRRNPLRAATLLARRAQAPARPDEDPGAEPVALHVLHQSLGLIDYDRAAIEAGMLVLEAGDPAGLPSRFSGRLGAIHRARAEIWRDIGDAWLRLGAPDSAVAAYESAAAAPVADPPALLWRSIYATLLQGRRHAAGLQLYRQLLDHAPQVPEHLVAVAVYLARIEPRSPVLGAAVHALSQEHPDSATLVRAAAVLLPPEQGRSALQAFVARRPRDMPGVRGMLRWLVRQEPEVAVDLAADLVAAQPDLATAYADELLLAVPRGSMITEPPACDRSPRHATLAVTVLGRYGWLGAAWQTIERARKRWPDDAGLARTQVGLAARLDEPELVMASIASSPSDDAARPWTLVLHAQALAAVGRSADAHALLEEAARLDADGQAVAWIELTRARVHIVEASDATDEATREAHLDAVVTALDAVLAREPGDDEANALLLEMYDRNGARSDADRRAEIAARVRRLAPQSVTALRLDVERDLGRGLDEAALASARAWVDLRPSDSAAYGAVALAWERRGQTAELELWLEAQVAAHPAAPAPVEAYVSFLLRRERFEDAATFLRLRLENDPGDRLALRMQEQVLPFADQTTEAVRLALVRHGLRPAGGRRWLEEALVLSRADRHAEALERVELLIDGVPELPPRHLVGAAGLLDALPAGAEGDDASVRLAQAAAARSGLPLVVLGPGIETLARVDPEGTPLASLLIAAGERVQEAEDPTPAGAGAYRRLAQRLIDGDAPAVAGRLLRARLLGRAAAEPDLQRMLLAMALIADAGTPGAATASMDLLHVWERRGLVPLLAGLEEDTLVAALFEVAQAYALVGADDGSDELLREVLRLAPDHAMALNNLGYRRLEIGVLDEQTVALIEKAARLVPDDTNVLDTVAWLRYHQGRFEAPDGVDGARELLERVMSNNVASPEALDHYGDTLWRLGRREEAANAWRQAYAQLADPRRRALVVRNLGLIQVQSWGLLVAEPEQAYLAAFDALTIRLRRKLEAIRDAVEPPIAIPLSGGAAAAGPGG